MLVALAVVSSPARSRSASSARSRGRSWLLAVRRGRRVPRRRVQPRALRRPLPHRPLVRARLGRVSAAHRLRRDGRAVSAEALLAAAFATLLSLAQRPLSTQVRTMRRGSCPSTGTIGAEDGTPEPITARRDPAPEAALRLLAAARGGAGPRTRPDSLGLGWPPSCVRDPSSEVLVAVAAVLAAAGFVTVPLRGVSARVARQRGGRSASGTEAGWIAFAFDPAEALGSRRRG